MSIPSTSQSSEDRRLHHLPIPLLFSIGQQSRKGVILLPRTKYPRPNCSNRGPTSYSSSEGKIQLSEVRPIHCEQSEVPHIDWRNL